MADEPIEEKPVSEPEAPKASPRIENPLAEPAKPTPKRIEQLVSPEMVKVQKPTIWMKTKKILFSESFANASGFAVTDVLFPSIRSTAADFLISIVENVFGSRGPNRSRGGRSGTMEFFEARPQRNYSRSSMMDRGGRSTDDRMYSRRSAYDFRLVTITSRPDAERILDMLTEAAEQWGNVSVGDYYDACGIVPASTDYTWGWFSLRRVGIISSSRGWMLDLPPAEPLPRGAR